MDIDQQKTNVKLVGFADYPNPDSTHSELNARHLMKLFKNIKSYFPKDGNLTEKAVMSAYKMKTPSFISLKNDTKLKKIGSFGLSI